MYSTISTKMVNCVSTLPQEKVRLNLNRVPARRGLNSHTYTICMTVHSTRQQTHRRPLRPGKPSPARSSRPGQGCRPAAPSPSGTVRCARSKAPWCRRLNTMPKCVLRERSSSSGQRRCETSTGSAAVPRSRSGSTGEWSCPGSR